ncbi:SIS domain-containing protein [Erysipelothrix rhusiopathiae]|nr:SIS domain-containing protein [Erysipelothrix sp. strain 2 (EsS2-6-Brazil)]MBK2403692.1 SIS domain-containing protein [Erysipelothrix sp. strain 2 (EsS2-7-Brazil)]NBA01430.1 SIS domain-containing protein [Erysipelothrix rhusiopathiae]
MIKASKGKRGDSMNTLMDCIIEIPEKLNHLRDQRDVIATAINQATHGDTVRKVVVVGSGSSYNTAFTTKTFAESTCHIEVELMYPSIFVEHYNRALCDQHALYIFISQGGQTKLVYEAIECANQLGLKTVSITESLETPIAKKAQTALEMGSGKEQFIFRTLGFSTTCTVLYLIYLSLGVINNQIDPTQSEAIIKDLDVMIQELPHIREASNAFYHNNKLYFSKTDAYIFSGPGALWPIAQEADIKFMEMLPSLTNSFELEELIHGPQNMFTHDQGFFLLAYHENDLRKSRKIQKFITQEVHARCIIVSNTDKDDFNINTKSTYFYPLAYMTFFQVLAYHIATDRGRDLSKTMYPQLTEYINKSLETKRS